MYVVKWKVCCSKSQDLWHINIQAQDLSAILRSNCDHNRKIMHIANFRIPNVAIP